MRPEKQLDSVLENKHYLLTWFVWEYIYEVIWIALMVDVPKKKKSTLKMCGEKIIWPRSDLQNLRVL